MSQDWKQWPWRVCWEVLRVVVGLPSTVAIAAWAGLRAFAHAFSEVWKARAHAGESAYWWEIKQRRESKERVR